MDKNKRIVFVHIPKTGGSTLREIISEKFSIEEVMHPINNYFTAAKMQIPKKIKFIHGHTAFGNFPSDKEVSNIYITIIRNPVERVISQYYFGVQVQQFDPKKVNLEEFITNKVYYPYTNNIQTQYISGIQGCNSDVLSIAKRNIEKNFYITGITELFEETLNLLNNQFGWHNQSYKRLNITEDKPEIQVIPKFLIEKINSLNYYDMELYNFAKRNLVQKLNGF